MKTEKEKCVSCGSDTPYTTDDPITERLYYTEAGGQLCKQCFYEIYNILAEDDN